MSPLLRAVLRLSRAMRRASPAAELTGGALALLAALHRQGPMSAVALARAEGLQPQSLSRVLARMEADGLITRVIDAEDKRRHVITLTDRGLGALDWAMTQRRRWLDEAMAARLSDAERAQLDQAAEIMLKLVAPPATDDAVAPASETTSHPVLLRAEPQLFVTDLAAALAFWADRLGFHVVFSHGEPAFYAQVARDRARLNLRLVHGPFLAPGFVDREGDALAASLPVRGDIAALFESLAAAGAPIHQALRTEPWGARTFILRDPDGNLILFAGDAA